MNFDIHVFEIHKIFYRNTRDSYFLVKRNVEPTQREREKSRDHNWQLASFSVISEKTGLGQAMVNTSEK